ncbi:MAG: hypothetical protein K8F62_10815, partial [Pseudorhodoplanes sp.]|nr:hypothetical protein [Pseudorhodoplanes sp.]
MVIIPYDRSSLNDATPIALFTEETIENIINDEWERDLTREMIEAFVVDPDDPNDDSQVVLPICRSENWREGQPAQVFNCRPAQVCDYIFGCGESLEVRLLNEFLDTEEGCGNNRCNGGCRAWLNQVNGTGNWHCGVDLVTHMDAECGYGDRRGVYMVHGGLYADFTENTYKFRYRDAENQLIWEYNYTHLPSSNVLGSNQRGQYVATGIKIGDY